ncbi:unnamed protein product, partial [Symbiodinium pilosum]
PNMYATLVGMAGVVALIVLFLILRSTMRPKRDQEQTMELKTTQAKKKVVPSIRGMERLRTEDCAQAVEKGTATKDAENRFRMDYWSMPLRQLS